MDYFKKRANKKYESSPEYRAEYDRLELEFIIAHNIIKLRKEKGFTQTDLAKAVHTKQSVISRIEQANHNVTIRTLSEIAKALGVTVETIISGSNKAYDEQAATLA
ncbi:transcriptional regulator with XRE-family HTH domain [Alkalihalobacillus xiaoxiensis]|uniref:Transcriptional regulator with XRE-family HTH domain n=1 Tax=Shouchella xiaoxiensis TaxID=766895 RepID=A0ABS2SV72_9BACI|nr:helix-turn-helix transcriptional regulator [Shouchella xiaoxiensis]MBM7839434.1 transcriptional regulator with XRE-family HTH domain [Shouchella xiaoxiensis]